MFSKTFYPTPKPLIRAMLEKLDPKISHMKNVLDPSAGMGDILEYVKGKPGSYEERSLNVSAI